MNIPPKAAPAGYYKNIIGHKFPEVRMALTNIPMSGVTIVPNFAVLALLKESKDEYAEYYIQGLESGRMVTIVETPIADKYFAPGELYFKS